MRGHRPSLLVLYVVSTTASQNSQEHTKLSPCVCRRNLACECKESLDSANAKTNGSHSGQGADSVLTESGIAACCDTWSKMTTNGES